MRLQLFKKGLNIKICEEERGNRTFALTETHIPAYPESPEQKAPIMKEMPEKRAIEKPSNSLVKAKQTRLAVQGL